MPYCDLLMQKYNFFQHLPKILPKNKRFFTPKMKIIYKYLYSNEKKFYQNVKTYYKMLYICSINN